MKLLFILTFKGSIEKWTKEGIANRELEVCFEYLRRDLFTHIQIFSYSANDAAFLEKLNFEPELKKRIELITPEEGTVPSFWNHLRHSLALRKINTAVKDGGQICKTNQINGCWVALLARLCGAKALIRCGYVFSRRLFKNSAYALGMVALFLELISYNLASTISVTTTDAKDYVKRMLLWGKDRIFVAPTYVNTEIFHADISGKPNEKKALFVGRLEPQKNIIPMIEACHKAGFALTIVGDGSLKDEMQKKVEELNLQVTHHPSLMNEEIADLFKAHRYFLLPSLHEGLPKVLIEAMSAAMVCVGTPTSGINDLIMPEKTGYLTTDFTAVSIAATLEKAYDDPKAVTYANAARAYILEHHSIASYAEREHQRMKDTMR